jgi:hypothetical protein
MREIADARGMLLSNVETSLVTRLQKFAGPDLDDVRDARKRFDKTSADYEKARGAGAYVDTL